jgi:hypothetical protein
VAERLAPSPQTGPRPESEPVARGDGDDPAERGAGRERWVAIVAIVLALVPVVCVLVFRAGRTYLPLGDEAIIDLRVRDVFTSHTPLVGAYSRGFNHPGPALFWLLAPFSELAGGAAWGTLVGAAVLQGVAIAASGWLAFRRGGLTLTLLVLTGFGFAYSSFVQGDQLLQPWNPNVAFPFFMLFLLQVWAFSTGDRWQLLGMAVIGSLLVQFHIGYLPLVLIGGAWAALAVLIDRRQSRAAETPRSRKTRTRWRPVLASSAAALVVLWIAPLIEQLTDPHGNLTAILDYFRNDGGNVAGLRVGAGIFAAEFKLPPPWLGGSDNLAFATSKVETASLWWLLIPAALLSIGFLAARAAQRRSALRMMQLALIMSIGSIIAISRVSVELQAFLFFWRVIVAVFVVIATIWSVALWSRLEQREHARRVVVAALLVVIAGSSLIRTNDDVLSHRDALGPLDTYAERLFDRAARRAPHGSQLLVRGVAGTTSGLAQGLFDDLDRRGAHVRVDAESGYQYGSERVATPSDVDQVWYISQDGSQRSLGELAGGRVVASVTPLSPAKERELEHLQDSMRAQLDSVHRDDLARFLDNGFFGLVVRKERADVDTEQADRIAELNGEVATSGGCRCVVVAFSADRAPNIPHSMGF